MLSGLGTACSEESRFQNKGRSSPKGRHTRSQQQAAKGAISDTRRVWRVYLFTKSLRPVHPAPSTALAARRYIGRLSVTATKYRESLLKGGEVDLAPEYVVLYFGLLAWRNVTTGNVW